MDGQWIVCASGENAAPILGHCAGLPHTRPCSALAKPREKMLYSAEALVVVFHQPCEYRNTSVNPNGSVAAACNSSLNLSSRIMPFSLIGMVRKWLMGDLSRALRWPVTRAICNDPA